MINMKNLVLNEEWEKLEKLLAYKQVPYRVMFDNHNGDIRKIISIEDFSIFPYQKEE